MKALIIFGLIFFTPIYGTMFSSLTPLNKINTTNNLRLSAIYYNITIDDLPGSLSNWLWAETQSWFGGGSGTELDPYILENLIVDGNLTDNSLSISNSEAFFIIQNCTFLNSSYGVSDGGIYLNNVTNGKINDNYFYNHRNAAIYATLSDYNIVSNNRLENHRHGIYVDGNYNKILSNSLYGDGSGSGIVMQGSYHDNLIDGNYIEHCWQGMFIWEGDNNNFSRNIGFKNFQYGIAMTQNANDNFLSDNIILNNSVGGIVIENSNDNTIEGNEVRGNKQHGIHLINGDYNTIYYNKLIENVLDGVHLATGSASNLIYRNYFGGNGRHAFDDGALNDWNSTTIGNYWDNHTSPDTSPVDGIVDNPYLYINGGAGSIDYLPIAEDGFPVIIINSPLEDQTFGINAPNFDIRVIDVFILDMWYTIDGGVTKYFFTTNGTIDQTAWDALPEGIITITFYANDTGSNLSFESVNIVKFIPDDNSLLITIVVISIVSGVAVVVAILLIQRRKARE